MSVAGISTKGNPEQQELIRLIMDNHKPIVFCEGAAGTGKNFCTLAAAIQLINDKRYGKIVYTRSTHSVSKDIGFLPGTVEDKLDPYMMALSDTLISIETKGKEIKANDALMKIDILPLFGIRGRNLSNTVVIVDEAQNLDLTTLRTLLTRMADFSKIILLGSFTQIDDAVQRKKPSCDFKRTIEVLKDYDFIGYVHLEQSMRSPYCTTIDKELYELEKNSQ